MSDISVSRLSCTLHLPVGWSPLTADVIAATSSVVDQKNINRLQVVLNLHEGPSRELHEEDSGLAAEIQRLDFKINVVLEIVSQLATAGSHLPEPAAVTLSSDRVVWEAFDTPPSTGERVVLNLFLDPRFPFPLVFHGRVDSMENLEGGGVRVAVLFDPLSDSFLELLERYIFRCHRRHVARLKKNTI